MATDDDGDVPIPLDPADLRTVWVMMGESERKLKKIHPDYHHGKAVSQLSDDFYRALSPGANAGAVWYRWARLELLQRINRKSEGRLLPGLMDGIPSDAVFKVFATMPLNMLQPGVGRVRSGGVGSADQRSRIGDVNHISSSRMSPAVFCADC